MRRRLRILSSARLHRLGKVAFAVFLLFIAYRILTPTSVVVIQSEAPDGSGTARLRKIYYTSHPSYKVDFRRKETLVWQNLLLIPTDTNGVPDEFCETLSWSPDGSRLFFLIDGKPVWQYAFPEGAGEMKR
jgi:hypothetical protein